VRERGLCPAEQLGRRSGSGIIRLQERRLCTIFVVVVCISVRVPVHMSVRMSVHMSVRLDSGALDERPHGVFRDLVDRIPALAVRAERMDDKRPLRAREPAREQGVVVRGLGHVRVQEERRRRAEQQRRREVGAAHGEVQHDRVRAQRGQVRDEARGRGRGGGGRVRHERVCARAARERRARVRAVREREHGGCMRAWGMGKRVVRRRKGARRGRGGARVDDGGRGEERDARDGADGAGRHLSVVEEGGQEGREGVRTAELSPARYIKQARDHAIQAALLYGAPMMYSRLYSLLPSLTVFGLDLLLA
jgi:hypothetical protein